jgi:hypothetical protein
MNVTTMETDVLEQDTETLQAGLLRGLRKQALISVETRSPACSPPPAPVEPKPAKARKPEKPSERDLTRRAQIEWGVRQLILHPEFKAFQIVMTGMLTYSVCMCKDRPPRSKYASLRGLGYTGSCGHELYSLVDWGDKVSVIGEFWEEGNPDPCQFYYYTADQRVKLKKQIKAERKGEKVVFSRWEKKAFAWDHCSAQAMVRKGGPSVVCWFPKEFVQQTRDEERKRLQFALASLPA